MLELSAYCQKLVEKLKPEELTHPVLEFFYYQDLLFYTKDQYQQILFEYINEVTSQCRHEIMGSVVLINEIGEYFLTELFENIKINFSKDITACNLEFVALTLRNYVLTKEYKYNGMENRISYYDSEIMRCLYHYNQPVADMQYQKLEKYYLGNKKYKHHHHQIYYEIQKYKEYCKKS